MFLPVVSPCSKVLGFFFLVFSFQEINYDVSWYGFLWAYPILSIWASWICRFISFTKLGEFLAIISLSTFWHHTFSSPYGTLMIQVLTLLSVRLFSSYLFTLHKFYWSGLKYPDLIFCHFYSTTESIWVFNFSITLCLYHFYIVIFITSISL